MNSNSVAPQFVLKDNYNIKTVNSITLSNGIDCFYLRAGDQELVRLELHFDVGANAQTKAMQSFFAAKMLPEGTSNKSSSQIAEIVAFHGAYLEIVPGNEKTIITLYVLNKHIDPMVDLLLEIIGSPSFQQEDLDRVKQQRLQNLEVSYEKTSFLASRLYKQKLFGDHYYARMATKEFIETTQVEDLKLYFENNLKNKPFKVYVSGEVTEEILSKIDAKFSKLHFDAIAFEANEKTAFESEKGVFRLNKEGAMQASIVFGFPVMSKDHPDFCKFSFVNEVFGGYFGSRLMSNIREEKGFTYGIGSYISHYKYASFLQVSTDVKTEHADDTVNEIHKEMRLLQNEPTSADELEKVKNYLIGSFASSLNTPFDLMDKFKSIDFYGLDYSFYTHYISEVKNITASDVMEMANKYFSNDPTVVVCG